MPEAESAVTGALGKQLPQQVLPPLQEYVYTTVKGKPVTFKAQVGLRLPEGSTTVMAPVPPPPKPGREGKGKLAKVESRGWEGRAGSCDQWRVHARDRATAREP